MILRTPRYWFNLLIAQKQTVLFSLKSVESILVWSAQWYWLPIEGMAWSGSIHIDRDSEQCTYCTTHTTQLCTCISLNLFSSLYFTLPHCALLDCDGLTVPQCTLLYLSRPQCTFYLITALWWPHQRQGGRIGGSISDIALQLNVTMRGWALSTEHWAQWAGLCNRIKSRWGALSIEHWTLNRSVQWD